MIDDNQVIADATGRWCSILKHLGVPESALSGSPCACPICGGIDRFRFEDRDEGAYRCRRCGVGNGLVLLRKLHGWNHEKAITEISKIQSEAAA